jgi:hypothetical protein
LLLRMLLLGPAGSWMGPVVGIFTPSRRFG